LIHRALRESTATRDQAGILAGVYSNERAAFIILRRLKEVGCPVYLEYREETPRPLVTADNTGRPTWGYKGPVWALYTAHFNFTPELGDVAFSD